MLAMRCAARGCPQKASRLPTLPMTGILSGAAGKDRVDRVDRALATRAWSKEKAEEHKQYWDEVLGAVDKPSAKRLLQYIDTSVPLGLAGFGRGPRSSRSKAEGAPLPARPPSYSFFYDTKLQHPDKVVLCRVGEFYETIGIDAVLMVQYAGLNPMGKEGNPPRAGCPRANLRRTVADLVENGGLSVVVCEEAPEPYSYGTIRRAPKQRYVAAIVTPALPHFLHNGVDSEVDIPVDSTPPLIGISPSVGGYSVIEVDAELMTVRTTEGLTEDAVYSRLHEGGLVPPLYLHSPPVLLDADTRLRDSVPEVEWKQRMASIFRSQTGSIVKYSDSDAVGGMLERVKMHLGMPADAAFRRLPSSSPTTRPRPLYFSTASNLGLHRTRGVPSLLDYALPAASPLAARRWLRSLLLQPPEPYVARSLHGACEELWKDHGSLPNFLAMSPANVVLKLQAREGNAEFFNELVELCTVVIQACRSPGLGEMTHNVLVAVESETGVRLEGDGLAAKLLEVRGLIQAVVENEAVAVGDGEGSRRSNGGAMAGTIPEAFAEIADVLRRMKASNEDFRGKVKDATIALAVEQVESAWSRVMLEANTCLSLAKEAATSSATSSAASSAGKAPNLAFDVNNNAAWIKVPRGTKILADKASVVGLIHPRDRNGKVETGVFSTAALEDALDEYRRSCVAAHDAVREQLRELAAACLPSIPELVGAATFSLVACVLEAHVREAKRRGWHLPQIFGFGPPTTNESNNQSNNQSKNESNMTAATLRLDGMWPYWLGGPGGNDPVARNSFEMSGMFLLTGPNMAGKSTMLRSTAAAALLGACGLALPAEPTSTVPYIDAFMLRNFSSDSPLEGRSSFAVEMMEMKYVLQDVTEKSLVLVDELGKGTEARAGAALAGAMLEALDRSGCLGAFATHLHDLLEMDLRLNNTTRMKMEVEARDDGAGRLTRRPTHHIVPGESTESLALEVARDCNLPTQTVQRAAELYAAAKVAEKSGEEITRGQAEFQTSRPARGLEGLEGLEDILLSTAARILGDDHPSTDPLTVHRVPSHALPGTQTTNRSCVYVARRPSDDRFYVGSSDQLRERILTHRNPSSGTSSQIKDRDAEFLYVVLPDSSAGSSAARAIEAAVIKDCLRRGIPLLSTHDAAIKSAPSRSSRSSKA